MEVEQNQVSRDWVVVHNGRRFHVNFTESDGQTLALANRDNWQVWEETEGGMMELHERSLRDAKAEQQQKAEANNRLIAELIAFCASQWRNGFSRQIEREMGKRERWLGEGLGATEAPGKKTGTKDINMGLDIMVQG